MGQKHKGDRGYFCKYLKGYRIFLSILGIWDTMLSGFGDICHFLLRMWDIFQNT